jgi:hydrogenase maturation protease
MGKFVLGIGNALLRDEGIGCHVAHAVERMLLPDVQVIDGGTCPGVLHLVEDADKVVIVDAVDGGGTPGQIYRFHLEDITLEQKSFLSPHDVGLVDDLVLMQLWNNIGEAVIIGVEPGEISWGLELSPEIQGKMPQIIETVLSELGTSADLSTKREE